METFLSVLGWVFDEIEKIPHVLFLIITILLLLLFTKKVSGVKSEDDE